MNTDLVFWLLVRRLRDEVRATWADWSDSHAYIAGATWLATLDQQETT